jgi:hypothetical protein
MTINNIEFVDKLGKGIRPLPWRGGKYLVAVQGFGRPVTQKGPQYERKFPSGSSTESFSIDTAFKCAVKINLFVIILLFWYPKGNLGGGSGKILDQKEAYFLKGSRLFVFAPDDLRLTTYDKGLSLCLPVEGRVVCRRRALCSMQIFT